MPTHPVSKIFIVLAVFAAALVTLSFVNRSGLAPVADRSHDRIEEIRAQRFSPVTALASVYERLEALRTQRSIRPVTMDPTYERLEELRVDRFTNLNHWYDRLEELRLYR